MATQQMSAEQIRAQRSSKINWATTITMVIFHVGAIAALFMFSWTALFVTLALWWVSGSLGIGMGYHRLLTHRGFKTPKWVEYVLTTCAVLTLEGGPIQWIATHRIHHAFTEGPGDPHSPREGTWWAHMGWILTGTAQQHDEVTLRRYAPDLMKDPFHVWMSKWFFVPVVALGVLLLVFGGWSVFFWGMFLRTTFGLHATWLVNSATHLWGTKRYQTDDDSTNNLLIALLTFGEGWHNNHHAHPRAARHGYHWYEIDMNWYGIRALQLLGLARDIKLLPREVAAQPGEDNDADADALSQAA